MSVNSGKDGTCTSINSNIKPFWSILLINHNGSTVCFQCTSDIVSKLDYGKDDKHDKQEIQRCPNILVPDNRTEGLHGDLVKITFVNTITRKTLGLIYFNVLLMGMIFLLLFRKNPHSLSGFILNCFAAEPQLRLASTQMCNTTNPYLILTCKLAFFYNRDLFQYAFIYGIMFKLDGNDITKYDNNKVSFEIYFFARVQH